MSKTKKRRENPQRRALISGWATSDDDEIERRRLRGANEAIRIEARIQNGDFFGIYRIHSAGGQRYRVEIRSLEEPINSCDCLDHRINGLGTCKHIAESFRELTSLIFMECIIYSRLSLDMSYIQFLELYSIHTVNCTFIME